MAKKSKKMQGALKKVDAIETYSVEEAVTLAKDTNIAKFGATVEVAYKLNANPKKADQQTRGVVMLPNGTGKTRTALVFAKGEKAKEAEVAGADFISDGDMVAKVQGGWFDSDVVVATPDMMATVGKLGRVLGPKGLIPSPKTGTVTMDVVKAVEEVKAGKVTYRVDKANNIHVSVGKVSFDNKKLIESFNTINGVLLKAEPSTTRGQYIKSVSVTTTFGPGIRVGQASF